MARFEHIESTLANRHFIIDHKQQDRNILTIDIDDHVPADVEQPLKQHQIEDIRVTVRTLMDTMAKRLNACNDQ